MRTKLPVPVSAWLNCRRQQPCHRQLLVVTGAQSWAIEMAQQVLGQANLNEHLWFGMPSALACGQYRQYLGQEYQGLVINCYSGLRANALMALSGVVKADGLMLLICPDLKNWPQYADPEIQKRTSYGFAQGSGRFIDWLIKHLRADPWVAILNEQGFTGQAAVISSPDSPWQHPIFRSKQQQQAVEAICRTAKGHAHRPLVITADRGRGKSSALGLAAASLMQQRDVDILLTAPAFAHVSQVFSHASRLLVGAQQINQCLCWRNSRLIFMPPDALLQSEKKADLLMVDEAATIPNSLLKILVQNYHRIVFSTTVHGYEGSGRGFELRFTAYLHRHTPGWRSMHLDTPIRWQAGDALERFWFKVMLMEEPESVLSYEQKTPTSLPCQLVTQEQLFADPELLQKIFQLLVNAHYQTAPDDLVRLLEAEDQHLVVQLNKRDVLGVMLLAEEGGEKLQSVATDISTGTRRVRGHLTAQSLAFSMGQAKLAWLSYLRVIRIAVQARLQRNALGSDMLDFAQQFAAANGFDFVAASFGLDGDLLCFWQNSGFTPVKLGLKKDASSGEHSLILLKAAHPDSEQILQEMEMEFQAEFSYRADRAFNHLPPRLALQLYKPDRTSLSPQEQQILLQFIRCQRPLYSCERVIKKLLLASLMKRPKPLQEQAFLYALLIQHHPVQHLCAAFDLSGKRALEQNVRQCCLRLLGEEK